MSYTKFPCYLYVFKIEFPLFLVSGNPTSLFQKLLQNTGLEISFREIEKPHQALICKIIDKRIKCEIFIAIFTNLMSLFDHISL